MRWAEGGRGEERVAALWIRGRRARGEKDGRQRTELRGKVEVATRVKSRA